MCQSITNRIHKRLKGKPKSRVKCTGLGGMLERTAPTTANGLYKLRQGKEDEKEKEREREKERMRVTS